MRLSHVFVMGVLVIVTPLAIAHLGPPQLQAQQLSPREGPAAGERPNPGRPRRRGRILQQLNLTQEQTQQLWAVRSQYQPQIRDHAQKTRAAQAELRQLLGSTASESEIKAKFQQVQQLRQTQQEVRMESILAMREILTPEQRQTFAKLMEQRRSQRRNRGF